MKSAARPPRQVRKTVISVSRNEPAKAEPSGDIGKEEALKAAYEAFAVKAEEVKLIKVRKDYDDGVQVYEIEFAEGYECKYSCEVVAASGKVIDKDRDVSRNIFDKIELFFEVAIAQLLNR